MSVQLVGISRSRDIPRLTSQGSMLAGSGVRWVVSGELAGAVRKLPAGPRQPILCASILDAIHRAIGVLPVRLGAAMSGDGEVQALLRTREQEFLHQLDHIDGLDEMALRIELPDSETAAAQAPAAATVATAYLARRREHYQCADGVNQQAQDAADHYVRALEGLFCEWQRLADASPSVLRMAFLVWHEYIDAFRAGVEIAKRQREHDRCTLLGPWPPYSFV